MDKTAVLIGAIFLVIYIMPFYLASRASKRKQKAKQAQPDSK